MRSRYTAYALGGRGDYLLATWFPATARGLTPEALSQRDREWTRLQIVDKQQRGDQGFVEFKAYYTLAGEDITHHEIASFRKEDGVWYFVDGIEVKPRPFKRVDRKVGPNEPCTCGSGKKYKKCCGKPGVVA